MEGHQGSWAGERRASAQKKSSTPLVEATTKLLFSVGKRWLAMVTGSLSLQRSVYLESGHLGVSWAADRNMVKKDGEHPL